MQGKGQRPPKADPPWTRSSTRTQAAMGPTITAQNRSGLERGISWAGRINYVLAVEPAGEQRIRSSREFVVNYTNARRSSPNE